MKTIIQKTLWLLLIAAAASSCAKEKDPCNPNDRESPCYSGHPDTGPSSGNLLLTEQKLNGVTIAKYEYNDQNQLITEHLFDEEGADAGSISYTYNASGLLSVANHSIPGLGNFRRETYTYADGNKPVSMIQTSPDDPNIPAMNFQYTYENDRLVSETGISTGEDKTVITMNYTYDSNGNLIMWEQFANNTLHTTLEYGDYDNQKAISMYGNPYFWKALNSNVNNPRAEKVTSQTTTVNRDLTVTFSYNGSGYPVKAEAYDRASKALVETRECVYKSAN